VLAAAPEWLTENILLIAIGLLAVSTLALFRFVRKTSARLVCLALIVALAVLAYVNRAPLKACADTCECSLGGRDVTVPFCDPVDLSAAPPGRAPA
jgi:hypothetical protein